MGGGQKRPSDESVDENSSKKFNSGSGMATIEKTIKTCLPTLEDETVEKLMTRLREVGATSVRDLEFTAVEDIADIVKPIQARKLMKFWADYKEEEEEEDDTSEEISEIPVENPTHQILDMDLDETPATGDHNSAPMLSGNASYSNASTNSFMPNQLIPSMSSSTSTSQQPMFAQKDIYLCSKNTHGNYDQNNAGGNYDQNRPGYSDQNRPGNPSEDNRNNSKNKCDAPFPELDISVVNHIIQNGNPPAVGDTFTHDCRGQPVRRFVGVRMSCRDPQGRRSDLPAAGAVVVIPRSWVKSVRDGDVSLVWPVPDVQHNHVSGGSWHRRSASLLYTADSFEEVARNTFVHKPSSDMTANKSAPSKSAAEKAASTAAVAQLQGEVCKMQSLLTELVTIKKQISDMGACQHPCDEVAE
ncbi:uncharacterized protein LOC108669921, partial [Hyalella azteca]|uniref:Uncharacterized protein LOC108669921 n=1 Tax=Hyalella azteca TaxID=294128 RepID=A0A8B7NHJ5_HYAAZ